MLSNISSFNGLSKRESSNPPIEAILSFGDRYRFNRVRRHITTNN
jgi:hypothetical protein